jgi:hypothetical protein
MTNGARGSFQASGYLLFAWSSTHDRLQLSTQRPQHPLHFVPGNWPAFHRNE